MGMASVLYRTAGGFNIDRSRLWGVIPECKPGKTFEVINQSRIKPLDEFDTTWLVARRGAAEPCLLFGKFPSKYFVMGEALLHPTKNCLVMGEASLHPKCGSFPEG
jgi:hypothetical protein